jgi:GNAT superfamily N-acetyltransferase
MTELTVRPAGLDDLDDVLELVPGGDNQFGCLCQYFRMSSGDYRKSSHQVRTEALKAQLAGDPAPGMLAYRDGVAVGWAGFAPRPSYERLVRSRTIPKVDDTEVWSVVCFAVRVGHRRTGVTKALLAGLVDYAREKGAPMLEAYPIDPGDQRVNTADLYVGTVKTFEGAGFHKVVKTASTSAKKTRWLMRMEL